MTWKSERVWALCGSLLSLQVCNRENTISVLCYVYVMFIFALLTDRHDALFVVGSLDETLELRGLRYHPIDIETSVSRAHRSIAER